MAIARFARQPYRTQDVTNDARAADARERRDVPNENAKPATALPRVCQRCGATLHVALHLSERIGQPAYDIFRCTVCGAVEWVAQDQKRQA